MNMGENLQWWLSWGVFWFIQGPGFNWEKNLPCSGMCIAITATVEQKEKNMQLKSTLVLWQQSDRRNINLYCKRRLFK